ncbi:AMP-binding protein [Altererythrobacter sp. SALINAS58]|uniref:AMP-binding protein n=1 Tax=Alteripontixanthobacter muriae TaxID=2705546 RepID=UPI001575D6F4|nr:AMP-binding protein [Alteripontixanthobacter muriae]NTZ43817.1 AMP-binding protein [Alteripontixanthobacter muriae]
MVSQHARDVEQRQHALAERYADWVPKTLHEVLDEAAQEFPDRPLVITDEKNLSYRDIAAHSRSIAAGLMKLGIQSGDKIALVLANYPEYAALKYALSRIGAIAVPVNIMLKADELKYVLGQSDSVLLVTMDSFRGVDHLAILDAISPAWAEEAGGEILPLLRQIIVFETGEGSRETTAPSFSSLCSDVDAAMPQVSPDAVCDILFTSGTTGPPKGVQLTHDMLMRCAFGSAYARAFEDGRRIIFALPLFHVFGYVEGLLSVPFVGGAMVPRLRFDAQDMLRRIEHYQVSDALLIPAMSLALIEAAQSADYDLTSLHAALASGGKAPPHLWAQLRKILGVNEITTGYGMTETTASTTVTRPQDPEERLLTTNGRLREVGPAADPALEGLLVDYRVVDTATGEPLPPGAMGELQARGLGVTRGYYNKPIETAEAFTPDGWLHTGDLGLIDADKYITLLGRTKESYRCGGEQVLPSEVEDVLAQLAGVEQAIVAPLPDERMGEVGAAFIIRSPGSQIGEEAIIDYAREKLARFKVPRHVFFVQSDELPLTASGRPQKFALTRMAQERLEII